MTADAPTVAAQRLDAWRAWLRARFADRLDAPTLEAAAADCEALRALWAPLLDAASDPGLDNGDGPFPGALPDPAPASPPAGES